MRKWSFLTNHARALICIAKDPGVRLRDIAAALNLTERSAFDIVSDLADSEYILKITDGRRNRYHILSHTPLHRDNDIAQSVGNLLELLADIKPSDGPEEISG